MKKLLMLFVVLCSLIGLAACKEKIESININEESIPAVINVAELDTKLSTIKLEVVTKKGTNVVNVSKSMISENDYAKLALPGTYTVEVSYEGLKTTLKLNIDDPNSYSVQVVYPNGTPVNKGVTVQWCTGDTCLLPVQVNELGTAYNELEDANYYIHIDSLPKGYTYDPNAYTTNKNSKKVVINLVELKTTTGEGTPSNPIVVSEGAFTVTYEGAGQANMKYYTFTPSVSGTYSIKSLAMDKLAMNAIDPYIGFLGTETDMSKIDISGNVDSKVNINFVHTFTAEANVTYTFIVFVSSATRFPASFDILISK